MAHAEHVLHGGGAVEPGYNIFGAKLVGGAAIDHEGNSHRRSGIAFLYEHALIPHWLEGEVSAGAILTDHATLIPVELLLKIPFRVSRGWELYVGAGPGMYIVPEHDEIFFGGVASVGSFYWISAHFGLLFELDYVLLNEHGAAHELEAAVGIAWRI